VHIEVVSSMVKVPPIHRDYQLRLIDFNASKCFLEFNDITRGEESKLESQVDDSPDRVANERQRVNMSTKTGFLQFRAPELVENNGSYGESVDVWSAGVCLYFMLTG
jgi:serine/threonine protein kinase